MYGENQPEQHSDKGSNRSRGATHDIGRGPIYDTNLVCQAARVNLNLKVV